MLQTAFNGLISGVIMTLPALAVTLLFGVLKFPNFAVGAMMTVAAYLAFALNAQLGWPLATAARRAAGRPPPVRPQRAARRAARNRRRRGGDRHGLRLHRHRPGHLQAAARARRDHA